MSEDRILIDNPNTSFQNKQLAAVKIKEGAARKYKNFRKFKKSLRKKSKWRILKSGEKRRRMKTRPC